MFQEWSGTDWFFDCRWREKICSFVLRSEEDTGTGHLLSDLQAIKHCNTLQYTTPDCTTLWHVATQCDTLLHVALHFDMLFALGLAGNNVYIYTAYLKCLSCTCNYWQPNRFSYEWVMPLILYARAYIFHTCNYLGAGANGSSATDSRTKIMTC